MSKAQLLLLICAMTLVVFFTGITTHDAEMYTSALGTGTALCVLTVLFMGDAPRKRGSR